MDPEQAIVELRQFCHDLVEEIQVLQAQLETANRELADKREIIRNLTGKDAEDKTNA